MALDTGVLQRASRLGAAWVGGPGLPSLLLAERILEHGLPQVLVLGRRSEDLAEPLEAIAVLHREGVRLNLVGVLGTQEELPAALGAHRRRLGSLLCALDAGLPCDLGGPALPSRLPGLLWALEPLPLDPAPLGPLERGQLVQRLPELGPAGVEALFATPPWVPAEQGWIRLCWPGVAVPEGAELVREPLRLPTATPVAEALRGALRAASKVPVPFLPMDEDPSRLLSLRQLTTEIGAFRGPRAAWEQALRRLASLPAPPHFCARC